MVNKSTTVNRCVLHTLQRNITHLAVITRKTNIKLGILKGGGKLEKSLLSIWKNEKSNPPLVGRIFFSTQRVRRLRATWKLADFLVKCQ